MATAPECLGELAHQALERQLLNQQLSGLLVPPNDLLEGVATAQLSTAQRSSPRGALLDLLERQLAGLVADLLLYALGLRFDSTQQSWTSGLGPPLGSRLRSFRAAISARGITFARSG